MLQLGHSLAQSFAGQALLWILSLLFRLTQKGRESPLGVEATRGRTKFPAIRVADFAEMYHFGGAMQTDSNLPENYVSMNLNFSSKFMPNLISRMLFSRLEEGMRDRIEDFTFVLEGDQEDELPERALCTIRMVNVDTQVVAKDVLFHALPLPKQEDSSHTGPKQEEGKLDFTKWMTNSIYDVSKVAGTPLRGSFTGDVADGIQVQIDKMDFDNDTDMLELVDSNDSLEIAANEVTKLLKDVEMPLRKYEKIESGMQAATHDSDIDEIAYMQVLKRVSRSDVKRFVQAANFDIKGAAVRIIQTVAWRERTFPIDIRKCRIELQNGQVSLNTSYIPFCLELCVNALSFNPRLSSSTKDLTARKTRFFIFEMYVLDRGGEILTQRFLLSCIVLIEA